MTQEKHVYELRPRRDNRSVDLISDVLPLVAYGTVSQTQLATNRIREGPRIGGARPFVNKRLVSAEIECATACHDQIFDS